MSIPRAQNDGSAGQNATYLRLHSVDVFVRDLERSVRFYVEKLGFELAFDVYLQSGLRCVGIAPPDGTAVLTLIQPDRESAEYKLIGRPTRAMFVADDVARTYREWSQRGVRFRYAPRLRRVKYQRHASGHRHGDASVVHGNQAPIWGQVFTRFEDVDGNVFALVSFDEVSKAIEAQRRAAQERLEAERRLAHELDIARRVQARLFPQTAPVCHSLEYAGMCAQARQVGGDYFDFFALGQERVALVLGDIAGKGMAAALLMANLQGNLRSQSMSAVDDPKRFLMSVNRLFFENTTASDYATLFFAEYCDRRQRLRYVNCGHLSGLLLRSDDEVVWLESTGTVLGLFPQWECSVGECSLGSGDILALYTDGITEACNEAGEDFGEQGVLRSIRKHRRLPPQQLIEAVLSDVNNFTAEEQHDDMTLLVATCKGWGS